MEGYFVRFTRRAEEDLERGYSFDSYRLYDTPEDVIEEYGLEGNYEIADYGDNPLYYAARGVVAIAPVDPEGSAWGVMLNGLCGFGPFETLEEAREFSGRGMYREYEDAEDFRKVIYRGREVSDPRCFDGVCFTPIEIFEFSGW